MAKKSNIIKFLHPQKFSTREKNRCALCGRNRGFYRRFSLCRLCLRALAHKGELPGVVKASW